MAVLLAAQTGPDAAADPADAAFARGDYASAERLSMEEAKGPHPGAALYLAGLAKFRSGDSAGALALLDKSWDTGDRPAAGAWHFNRGACLYDLGRLAEAETDFLAAASLDDLLAATSLIDAGFAALDAGAIDRARSLSARAGAIAQGPARSLLDDLNTQLAALDHEKWAAEYRAGLAAYDEGTFASAREHFLAAAAFDPADGKSRIMSGACALQVGDRTQARAELDLALTLHLDAHDEAIARDYLASISTDPGPAGWHANALVSAGFDSNALQTGFIEPNEFPGANSSSSPSGFVAADAALSFTGDSYPALFGIPATRLLRTLSYRFEQLAYAAADASDRSWQQHTLLLSLGASRESWRVGLSLGAQFSFNGLDEFRALQLNGVGALWGAYDEGARLTSRLDLGFEPKVGFNEFGYLGGQRYDATLTQELRTSPATFTLGYRFRAELIGTATEAVPPPPRMPPTCPGDCATAIDPFGYTSHTLWLAAHAAPGTRWTFDLSGGAEWRAYTSDNQLILTETSQVLDERRRDDTRWFASASASFWLRPGLALDLRYDLVLNRSNIDTTAEVRSYDKHVFSLGTAINW